jgi:hypothetical protein
MPVHHPIQLVPAIKKITLSHGGYAKDVEMEFIPSLNIITGPGFVWGESIILRSILRTVFPSSFYPCPLSAERYFNTGCISLEFMYQSVTIDVPTLNRLSGKPSANDHYDQYMLSQLHSYINFAPHKMALLIEEESTCDMKDSAYRLAVEWMNTASCQIICVVGNRFSLPDFPDARVFSCTDDTDNNIRIEVMQQGASADPVCATDISSPVPEFDMTGSQTRQNGFKA